MIFVRLGARGFSTSPPVASVVRSPHSLFWKFQIGGWLLFVPLATGFALVAFNDPGQIVLTGVIRQVVSFGLTLALWCFYRRWPADTFRLAPHIAQIALACTIVTAVDTVLVEIIRATFAMEPASPLAQRGSVPLRLSIYLAWSSLYFMIRQELETRNRGLRLAQIELAAREAELASLRAQVNPHFLFNALNSILAECGDKAPAARAITRSLADYLRASLLQRDHHAPLGEEVDSIAAYLRVEQARFEEKLIYSFAIEPAAREALVPLTVLLPLVENAVKYGMRTSPPPLRIAITATRREDVLTLTVENSGHWFEPRPGAADSTQIGLANLRRRLALLHGDAAALTIHPDAHQVRIVVTLPVAPSGK
ncbi:sensor histidine kinase [Rariglobus hedericola]|nr:histidine kinase [Rariglobus hedericola]